MIAWPDGYDRVVLDEAGSTNDEARARVASGTLGGPVWIAARRQSAGKGRSGRGWETPEGNLAATLLMLTGRPPAELARFSFHAALAVADLLDVLAAGHDVRIKWPNDVLLDGAKVAGILLESFAAAPGQPAPLAIGIGVNLAHHPDPSTVRWPPTSIAAATGAAPAMEDALAILAGSLARWLALDAEQGFGPVRAAWIARAGFLGEEIEARLPNETLTGTFEDIDPNGAMILASAEGRRIIPAADIHLPE